MGIVIIQLDYHVFIGTQHKPEALKALHCLYEPFDGRNLSRQLDFVEGEAVVTAPTLEDALSACRWCPENDD